MTSLTVTQNPLMLLYEYTITTAISVINNKSNYLEKISQMNL
jgi:hypothetical protein